MTISNLPPPPNRANQDRATFVQVADTFLGALPVFVTEANALASDVNSDAVAAAASVLDAQAAVTDASLQADRAEAAAGYRVSVGYKLYSQLAATTGTSGQLAVVFGPDAGTHTDPVVGGSVANTGLYRYSTSPAGWERVSNLSGTFAGDNTWTGTNTFNGPVTGSGTVTINNAASGNQIGKLVVDYLGSNSPTIRSFADTVTLGTGIIGVGSRMAFTVPSTAEIGSSPSSTTGIKVTTRRANTPIVFQTSPATNDTLVTAMTIAGSGDVSIDKTLTVTGNLTSRGSAITLGVATGSPAVDFVLNMNQTNFYHFLNFQASGTTYGKLLGHKDVGCHFDFTTHIFRNGTGATEYARINSSGNFAIGQTTATEKVEVAGNIKMTGNALVAGFAVIGNQLSTGTTGTLRLIASAGVNYIQSGTSTSSTSAPLVFGNIGAGSEWMRLTATGNLGVGNPSPAEKVDVTGNVQLSGVLKTATIQTGNGISTGDAFVEIGGLRTGDGVAYVDLSAQSGVDFNSRLIRYAGANGGLDLINSGTGGVTISSEGNAPVVIKTSATERFRINGGGGMTSSNLADAVGYKGLPQNAKTAAYTLTLDDMGKHISITTGGVVIPANASVGFNIGSAITIFNNSASTQSISITSDTLRQAGTTNTGTRTLAAYGLATILKVDTTTWVISGNVT